MKRHKCKKCGIAKEVNEDNWHCNKTKSSGFDLSKCRDCARQYHYDRLHRVVKKPHVEAPLTPYESACAKDRVKRAVEPTVSIFRDVL